MIDKEENFCEDAISRQKVLDIVKFEEKWLKDAKSNNPNTGECTYNVDKNELYLDVYTKIENACIPQE